MKEKFQFNIVHKGLVSIIANVIMNVSGSSKSYRIKTNMSKPLHPICLDEVRQKFMQDGVVYPLHVFEGNTFVDNGYVDKYKEFRRKCQNKKRTTSSLCNDQCRNHNLSCVYVA